MINKKENRLRRAGATRARIKLQKVNRLTVHRTNLHIYASIISASGDRVLVSASTAEAEVRAMVNGNGGNIAAAKIVGARLARLSLPRPRCRAGRGRARSRPQVLIGIEAYG